MAFSCLFSRCSDSNPSFFFFSSRRRHTRCGRDWSSDVCSSDLACERLFNLSAEVLATQTTEPPASFTQQVARQLEATLSQALEENNHYFKREQEKLETWADEQIQAAEQALEDTKLKLRDLKRQARQAQSVEEQKAAQENIKKLERQQRRQREQVFDVEDQIEERRDTLIAALEKRMHQQSSHQTLFRLHFEVI